MDQAEMTMCFRIVGRRLELRTAKSQRAIQIAVVQRKPQRTLSSGGAEAVSCSGNAFTEV